MKSWSLGYEILRTYVRFAFWLTHKRIIVTGRHFIPKGKPVIFAANHQNALMDPLALSCTNTNQMVWLARADIFKTKAARAFLSFIKMIPIYRIRDGKENLSNNEQVFKQLATILENKQTVALFPEAAHSGKRQMLAHKKAIPRIALETEEKNDFKLDLQIVPAGIFYSHYWNFNRTLVVQYGKPINIDACKKEYEANPQKALIRLRDEIYESLHPLAIQIESQTLYNEYEDIRQLVGLEYSKNHRPGKKALLRQLSTEKAVIEKLQEIEKSDPQQFEKLINSSSSYFDLVRKAGLIDEQVYIASNSNFINLIFKLISLLISLPIFLFGFIFNALPFYIPRTILRKKVKDLAFLSTFNFVAGLIFFPIFYLIESSILYFISNSAEIPFFAFLLMPFAGKIAYKLFLFYKNVAFEWTVFAGSKNFRNNLKQLLQKRKDLVETIFRI